ncbi:basic proline-rich protein-like [Sphaerodactylus townsendi]|uniref:basic proline-rich protein-like n=1 Tax=Sphaerodactylus townsendi TaxID=933632 RepID=UPI002026D958|nr:basic proline-rich protein-like [Sphaerodactylus townsendi]
MACGERGAGGARVFFSPLAPLSRAGSSPPPPPARLCLPSRAASRGGRRRQRGQGGVARGVPLAGGRVAQAAGAVSAAAAAPPAGKGLDPRAPPTLGAPPSPMEPKPRLSKRAAPPGARICSPPPGLTSASPCCCPDGSPPAAGLHGGLLAPCKPPPPPPSSAGNAVYTVLVGDRRRSRRRSCEDGDARSPPGKNRLQVWQKSPTHCNGKTVWGEVEPFNGQPRHLSDPLGLKGPEEETVALQILDQMPPNPSAYIPVPRQRYALWAGGAERGQREL